MPYRLRRVVFLVLLWAIVCCFHAAASTRRQSRPFGRLPRMSDSKNETITADDATIEASPLKEEINSDEEEEEDPETVDNATDQATESPPKKRRHRLPDWLTGNQQQRDSSDDTERQRDPSDSKNDTRTSSTNATRTSGRFWPADNGFPAQRKNEHDDEQAGAQDEDDSSDVVEAEPSKQEESEKGPRTEERGWKHFLKKQQQKESSILKAQPREEISPPLETDSKAIASKNEPKVSTQDTEPKEKVVDSTESESPKIESPTLNVLRELRSRFRPKQSENEEQQGVQSEHIEFESLESQPALNETVRPSKAAQSSETESKAPDTENRVERSPPFVAKLRESASNANSFLRQLPWRSQQQDNATVLANSDEPEPVLEASAPSSVDTDDSDTRTELESISAESNNQKTAPLSNEESQSLAEQSIEQKNMTSSAGSVFTRLKESAANTTTFLHGLVPHHVAKQTNKTRVGTRNPSNPINLIRNLPWTPEGGAKYNEDTSQTPPVKVNPIQFLRGLPWTPRNGSIAERSSKSPESDKRQVPSLQEEEGVSLPSNSNEQGDKVSTDEGALEKASRGKTISIGDEMQNGTSDQSEDGTNDLEEKQLLAKKSHSIVKVPAVEEEEGDMMSVEVDDILSKYLLRQEEESVSVDREEVTVEQNVDADDSTTFQLKIEEDTTRAEFAERGGEKSDTSETSDATNGKESSLSHHPAEGNDGDTGNASSYSLDSLVRRVLGSIEEQQNSIEAGHKPTADEVADSSTSNATSHKKVDEESQQPSDSATEESVQASNRTSTPADTDQTPPQQQKDERRGQQPPPQQQQQPTVIIMGGPQDGRSMPADLTRRPVSTPSLVLVEALVTILGTAIRIWMLSFLARWWSEEETLRPVQHFVWERLNDRYLRDSSVLQNVLQLPPTGVPEWRWRRYLRKQHRVEGKISKKKPSLPPQTFARTVIVLNIDAEMNIPHLEQAVTFILSQHREQAFGSVGGLAKELEVILLVNSPGGAVQDFGLAGAQVRRLAQEAGVTTTVCVDQIAASGGYMVASQADRIFASTFAIVGSIGVIREGINIQDALERYGIKGIVLKAGDSKVPLTMLGSVTKSDLAKAQNTLDLMHSAFKEFVVSGRPELSGNIEEVANGDIFFGDRAMELSLIDRIVTSEEYLLERVQAGDRVMKLHRAHQYAGRRKLFHPLDFLREKGSPLRAACARWMKSDVERKLSRVVTATSVMGVIQFLSHHRFIFGGGFRPR